MLIPPLYREYDLFSYVFRALGLMETQHGDGIPDTRYGIPDTDTTENQKMDPIGPPRMEVAVSGIWWNGRLVTDRSTVEAVPHLVDIMDQAHALHALVRQKNIVRTNLREVDEALVRYQAMSETRMIALREQDDRLAAEIKRLQAIIRENRLFRAIGRTVSLEQRPFQSTASRPQPAQPVQPPAPSFAADTFPPHTTNTLQVSTPTQTTTTPSWMWCYISPPQDHVGVPIEPPVPAPKARRRRQIKHACGGSSSCKAGGMVKCPDRYCSFHCRQLHNASHLSTPKS
jgi:hypothetical protein